MPHEILAPHIGRMVDILSRTAVRQHFGNYMNPSDPNCMCSAGLLYYHLVNTKHHEVLGLWKFDPTASSLYTEAGSITEDYSLFIQLSAALRLQGFPPAVASVLLHSIIHLNDTRRLTFAQIADVLPGLATFYLWCYDHTDKTFPRLLPQLLTVFFSPLDAQP